MVHLGGVYDLHLMSKQKLDFSQRIHQAELLDDFALGGETLEKNLREIAWINRWLGGNAVTLKGFEQLWQQLDAGQKADLKSRSVTIADLGCGGGELLRLLAEWGRRKGLHIKGIGLDANPHAVAFAARQHADDPSLHFEVADVLSPAYADYAFDLVTCTLFTHHFTDEQLVSLFQTIRSQTSIGLVINDLHRHPLAYHSISWLTHWFSGSPLTKHDARLSVRRGFSKTELGSLLQAAGYQEAQIAWAWAFRWRVVARC